jgi:hypothetical protein
MTVLKWKYLVKEIRSVDANGTTQVLNELGENGWELIAVRDTFYFFKKPEQATHVV